MTTAAGYATQAERYWRTYRPSAIAELTDPTAHFRALGTEIAQQIEELTDRLVPQMREEGMSGEEARAAARTTAEELVTAELLWIEKEPGTERRELSTFRERVPTPAPETVNPPV